MAQWEVDGLKKSIESKHIPVTESGCWIWTGAQGAYGGLSQRGRHIDAHRASWIVHKGDIPDGMRICHKCDVPLCINPEHLFMATAKENSVDMVRKGRHKKPSNYENVKRGEIHWNSKIKNSDVLKILSDPRPQAIIAKDYGVSQMCIQRIKARESWRHVTTV